MPQGRADFGAQGGGRIRASFQEKRPRASAPPRPAIFGDFRQISGIFRLAAATVGKFTFDARCPAIVQTACATVWVMRPGGS